MPLPIIRKSVSIVIVSFHEAAAEGDQSRGYGRVV